MKKNILICIYLLAFGFSSHLAAHCQMPCGIYHDAMVYDQIDQYIETMFKGMTVISENELKTPRDRNTVIRWVMLKEKASDELATLITSYFLQQKIKPGEEATPKRLESAHKLLVLAMQIKQGTSIQVVEDFADEWDDFKLMFHVKDYECQVEKLKQRKRMQKEDKKEITDKAHTHLEDDEDHEHD